MRRLIKADLKGRDQYSLCRIIPPSFKASDVFLKGLQNIVYYAIGLHEYIYRASDSIISLSTESKAYSHSVVCKPRVCVTLRNINHQSDMMKWFGYVCNPAR